MQEVLKEGRVAVGVLVVVRVGSEFSFDRMIDGGNLQISRWSRWRAGMGVERGKWCEQRKTKYSFVLNVVENIEKSGAQFGHVRWVFQHLAFPSCYPSRLPKVISRPDSA